MAFAFRIAGVALLAAVVAFAAAPQLLTAAPQPIVTAINVRGNAHVPIDRIASVVRSQAGLPLDPKQVAADQAAILSLGYFTDVKSDVRPTPGGVSLNFIVIENPVVSKIVFNGNQHVSNDILSALMDTTVGAVLNTNTLRDDVTKINSYYDKLGYVGTRHVKNIAINPGGTVTLDIQEGVTVTAIVLTGDSVLPPPAILNVMKTKQGSVFSQQTFDADLQAISKLYTDLGLNVTFDNNTGPDPAKPGAVDVALCEVRVGAIEIAGNSKTKDYVIRRLLRMRPNDLITESRLKRDYELINNTQFFKSVDLSTKPFGNKCGYVTLVWTVVEQRTGTASVGVSYGGGGQYGQGLSGNLGYSEANINGTGNGAQISLQRGLHISDVSLSVSVPYVHKFKPDSASFSIFNNVVDQQPYPVYKEPGNNPFFTITPQLGAASQATTGTPGTTGGPCAAGPTPCTSQFALYSTRQAGISIGLGHPVADYTRMSYGFSATRLSQSFGASGFPQQFLDLRGALVSPNQSSGIVGGAARPGSSRLFSFNAGLFRDDRDDPLSPRYGGTSSISSEWSSKSFGSDYNYTKTDYDLTKFFPVRHHSTLALHFNYGWSSGGASLPYNDLFSLTDQQLRNTTFVFYGDREVLGQAELRIPVTQDKKFTVAFFADSGDVPYVTPVVGPAPSPTPIPPCGPHCPPGPPLTPTTTYVEAPFHLKMDFGFGIRVQTPIVPQPIRIDFAFGQGGHHVSFGLSQSF
ncbi:MAG TPA: POTRA domain-containing protein [Candidatus Eremiobacteraceae bacterium]|nr:POTRA domain-containing protein [Candidatus Eremiobacteraceae bacterium]